MYQYVITRADLPHSQRAVQSAHAAATAEAGVRDDFGSIKGYSPFMRRADRRTMIILSVPNKFVLRVIKILLFLDGIEEWSFYEPDYKRGLTSLSFFRRPEDCPWYIRKLSLMAF